MSEFHKVIAELADLEAAGTRAADRGPASPAPAVSLYEQRLLAAVYGEIANTAVLIAISTGLANAMQRQPDLGIDAAAIANYTPTHTAFFRKAVVTLIEERLAIEDGARLLSYLARLDLAARLTRSAAGGSTRAELADGEVVADAWRRAAEDAAAAIETLARAAGALLAHVDRRAAEQVLGLLRLAVAGHSPCLGAGGRISIPGWAERRRAPRRSAVLAAIVLIAGKAYRSTLRDVSATGLGLECVCPAPEGAAITVQLDGGRQLTGKIAWSNGDRIGVELASRLATHDPLLQIQ